MNQTANVSIMKAPIGDTQFCEAEITKRVDNAADIMAAIARLADEHCALYLLRFQVGRMDYTVRTTPGQRCLRSLRKFDSLVRHTYNTIIGRATSDSQWAQACLPLREGGKGMRSAEHIADIAYYSSRAATWSRCEAIYANYSSLQSDPIRECERAINTMLDDVDHVPILPCADGVQSQKAIADKTSVIRALKL